MHRSSAISWSRPSYSKHKVSSCRYSNKKNKSSYLNSDVHAPHDAEAPTHGGGCGFATFIPAQGQTPSVTQQPRQGFDGVQKLLCFRAQLSLASQTDPTTRHLSTGRTYKTHLPATWLATQTRHRHLPATWLGHTDTSQRAISIFGKSLFILGISVKETKRKRYKRGQRTQWRPMNISTPHKHLHPSTGP